MTFALTRDQLEAKRAELNANGIALSGDNGTVSHSGVTVEFSYDEANQTLKVDLKKRPFPVTRRYVEGKIEEWFNAKG